MQINSYYHHTDALGDFYGSYVHIIEYASNVLWCQDLHINCIVDSSVKSCIKSVAFRTCCTILIEMWLVPKWSCLMLPAWSGETDCQKTGGEKCIILCSNMMSKILQATLRYWICLVVTINACFCIVIGWKWWIYSVLYSCWPTWVGCLWRSLTLLCLHWTIYISDR